MSSDGDRDVTRLYRVHKTIFQMMVDRGYVVQEDLLNMTLDDFRARHAPNGSVQRDSTLTRIFLHRDTQEAIMVAFFAGEEKKKIGVAPIRVFCEQIVSNQITRGIIVHQQPLSPQAVKTIQNVSEKYRLEAFEEAELIVNITHHTLVPKHEVLSAEDKKNLLERYRLKETQLPRITMGDPVARYFGLRRGEVVKIIRKSETAGRYVTYRLCF
ncbi:DNA-directed RNA polymerases II 24 kDa polypeptide (RNA polymerase II subunit 5) [Allomyces arbusculus]|nr:DNA-directed RNA polymerases II 24 kDa polypeptide (RNA polymerase II subunit 5) [Allomyces arbusculus]